MTVIVGTSAADEQAGPIREARRLAAGLGEPLHVVHVYSEAEFETATTGEDGGARAFGEVRADAEAVAEAALRAALGDASENGGVFEPPVEAVGLVGDPATELVEHAAHADASLLVVGGRRRSPVGKAIFGSITQDVLFEADCPVVACFDAADAD